MKKEEAKIRPKKEFIDRYTWQKGTFKFVALRDPKRDKKEVMK